MSGRCLTDAGLNLRRPPPVPGPGRAPGNWCRSSGARPVASRRRYRSAPRQRSVPPAGPGSCRGSCAGGLAVAGGAGVGAVLDSLAAEIRSTLTLMGVASVVDLNPSVLRRADTQVPEKGY
ncbi:alpha-hydroxy-acid oxidizing protein [Mycolicibacterium neworleansense]|nr:alpha-hydroxy-acid oxidizing protein [Mycolicibacterium neworleansense]